MAEIPRSTLSHIESGSANPSLYNLVSLSAALGVGIEELLSKPRNECALIPSHEVPVKKRSQGRVSVFKLLPDKLKGIEIDRLELQPKSFMGGHPHIAGTKEYLTVVKGEFTVHISGDTYNVKKGDVFAFPGNQPHSYGNPKDTISIAVSVVIPVTS